MKKVHKKTQRKTARRRKASEPASIRGQERQARILKAATELFLKEGYGETSIDAIVDRSGGSKATLYSYFPTKGALFRAVVDAVVSNRDEPELEPSDDIRKALTAFAEQRMRVVFSKRHRELLGLIIAERDRFPDIARLYYERGPQRSHDLLVEYMQALNKRNLLDISSADESAEFFIGMLLHHWYIAQLYLRPASPTAEERRHRAAHVVAGFLEAFAASGKAKKRKR
jgi:AcrR family transcriptional regulator